MALSSAEAQLVIESWQIVKLDIDGNSLAFFLKLFDIAPTSKALFSFLRDHPANIPLHENEKLCAHARLVLGVVSSKPPHHSAFRTARVDLKAGESAVQLGEKAAVEALGPVLVDLGRRHAHYGVKPAHYDILKWALLHAIQSALGPMWTIAHGQAWTKAYDALASVMKTALQEGRAMHPADNPFLQR